MQKIKIGRWKLVASLSIYSTSKPKIDARTDFQYVFENTKNLSILISFCNRLAKWATK